VTARDETSVWNEFWVMWRRVAGGLTAEQQEAVWTFLKPHLARRVPAQPSKNAARPKGAQPEGLDEMVRTAASLEHLPPVEKIALGDWIAARLRSSSTAGGPWAWSLGRLGARVPLYGSGHRTVDVDRAAEWLSFLLETDWRVVDGAAFAVAQLARLTGDRRTIALEILAAEERAAVNRFLSDPKVREILFRPGTVRTEQHLSDTRSFGIVDRLIIAPDRITLIDFKTGRVGHLADKYRPQMIRYRNILQGLFGGRQVECYLLFIDEPHRILTI
ncbi:MAG: hypothetical protein Q8O11_05850, partial [Syntrophales bacterium]|nr:hypothetical protein [Syntrophales bacterium]